MDSMDSMDSTEHHDFDALDFTAGDDYATESDESDALDFSSGAGVSDDSRYDPAALAFEEPHAPCACAGGGPDDPDGGDPDGDDEGELEGFKFTVVNPPETVAVTALVDGRVWEVELAATASKMTEAELAEEILVIADLARQKALAGQQTYLMGNEMLSEGLNALGLDGAELMGDFTQIALQLPTERQAEEAQAAIFASRYVSDRE